MSVKILIYFIFMAHALQSAAEEESATYTDDVSLVARQLNDCGQEIVSTIYEKNVLRKHFSFAKIIFYSAQEAMFWRLDEMLMAEVSRNRQIEWWLSSMNCVVCRDDSLLSQCRGGSSIGDNTQYSERAAYDAVCQTGGQVGQSECFFEKKSTIVQRYLHKKNYIKGKMALYLRFYDNEELDESFAEFKDKVLALFPNLCTDPCSHMSWVSAASDDGGLQVHNLLCSCFTPCDLCEKIFLNTGVRMPCFADTQKVRAQLNLKSSMLAYFNAAKHFIGTARALQERADRLRWLHQNLQEIRARGPFLPHRRE